MEKKDLEFEKHLQTCWAENYNFNLENDYFNKFLDLSFLVNTQRLSRYPVVMVLAGPSLDNHIEELKAIRNKVIVMSCDTVTYRLNEEGIIPDFVVSIDPQRDFLNLLTRDINKTSYLIIPTSGSSTLVKEWQEYIFFFNQFDDSNEDRKKFFLKLNKPTKHFMPLINRFFIGMTMFQIALNLDLYPVTFLGADFCQINNQWYVKGFEKRRYEGREVKPELDDEVGAYKTTKIFHFYRDVLKYNLEEAHKRKKLRFFDSSDGILNIERISLKDFGDKYGKENLNVKNLVKLKV